MRKGSLIIILLTIFLCGCKKDNQHFTLQGNIKDLANDTILIYSLQSDSGRVDTIFADDDKFHYTALIDTITQYTLLIKDAEIPVFGDKGIKASVEGNVSELSQIQVSGGKTNDELNSFRMSVQTLQDSAAIILQADSFIRNHPFSRASVYVLDEYFVQKETPDYAAINSLINSMGGELQDLIPIKNLSETANKQESVGIGRRAPTFNGRNTKGAYISSTTFKDQYVLLNFWASWSDVSGKDNATLKKAHKQFKKEKKFGMLGVSLDMDKKAWLEAIKKDTLSWEQISDFKGWENEVAKQFGIESLPSNVLISPDRTIIAKNLTGQDLINKLEEILKKKDSAK